MRVGLDARKLWDGGIGTYIRGLVAGSTAQAAPPHFAVFVNPDDRGSHPWPPTCEERAVRAGKYSLAEHFVLARAARDARVDLFHAPHYTLPMAWRGPSVVTIQDLIHLRFPTFFPFGAAIYARVVAGMAARRARLILASSESARDDIVSLLGVRADRVRVIPLGVAASLRRCAPEEGAAFVRERGLPAEHLLYVGARKRHKNIEVVLDALRILGAGAPPLVLAGPPWPSGHPLANQARAAGIERLIHFAGVVPDEAALARLYSAAAVLVQPSLIEGFGLPPLEAMACGTPVIASDIAPLRETLSGAAVLVPAGDAAAWAQAISRTLGDRAARDALARGGPERAARYTWERTAEHTVAAYREALASA